MDSSTSLAASEPAGVAPGTVPDTPGGLGPTTLTQAIAAALTGDILSGRLEPGSWIRPLELAKRFGTSPTPVREALRSLAADGVVVTLPRRGYQVSPASRADLEDVYRIRLVLDPMAMELAVPRLTQEDLAQAARALDALIDTYGRSTPEAHRVAHRAFHFALYQACGSPWLLRILRQLWDNSERYQRLSLHAQGGATDRALEHRAIFKAAKDGGADEAVLLTRAHLSHTIEAVTRVFGEDSGADTHVGIQATAPSENSGVDIAVHPNARATSKIVHSATEAGSSR